MDHDAPSPFFPSPNQDSDILVVDDEPTILNIAQAVLETIEESAATAADGHEAHQWVRERVAAGKPITLIILDLTMPGGLSGFETLDNLRKLTPTTPVVACSGFFEQGARDLCQSIGFADVLVKPFKPQELVRLVQWAREGGVSPSPVPQREAEAEEESPPPSVAPNPFLQDSSEIPQEDPVALPAEEPFDFEVSADVPANPPSPEPFRTKHRHPLMKGFGNP